MESIVTSLISALENLAGVITAAGGAFVLIAIYVLVALFALLLTYFFRIHIAYRMAKNRHRDPLGWVLLSFFFSPVLTWIILLIAGDAK